MRSAMVNAEMDTNTHTWLAIKYEKECVLWGLTVASRSKRIASRKWWVLLIGGHS